MASPTIRASNVWQTEAADDILQISTPRGPVISGIDSTGAGFGALAGGGGAVGSAGDFQFSDGAGNLVALNNGVSVFFNVNLTSHNLELGSTDGQTGIFGGNGTIISDSSTNGLTFTTNTSNITINDNQGFLITTTTFEVDTQSFLQLSGGSGIILQASGAADQAAFSFNGNLFTGGTGTSTLPFFYINQSSFFAPTTLNPNGTFYGINQIGGGLADYFNFFLGGTTSVFKIAFDGSLTASGTPTFPELQVFANNAAAISGGLAVHNLYRTGADPDVVCIVH